MATVTIRNLLEATRRALKARAARHNRSMNAEVREILDDAVGRDTDFMITWLNATPAVRGEFELPPLSRPRDVDLS